eukprot:11864847-Alexandrium_andersonii.AAC.1
MPTLGLALDRSVVGSSGPDVVSVPAVVICSKIYGLLRAPAQGRRSGRVEEPRQVDAPEGGP